MERTIFDIVPGVQKHCQNSVNDPRTSLLLINGQPYRHFTLKSPLSTPLMMKLHSRQRRDADVILRVDLKPQFSAFAARRGGDSQESVCNPVFCDSIFLLLCHELLPPEGEQLSFDECLSLMEFLHHHELRVPVELVRRASREIESVGQFFELLNALGLHYGCLRPCLDDTLQQELQGYRPCSSINQSTERPGSDEHEDRLLRALSDSVREGLQDLLAAGPEDPAFVMQLIMCVLFSWPLDCEHSLVRKTGRVSSISPHQSVSGELSDLLRAKKSSGGDNDSDEHSPESTVSRLMNRLPRSLQFKRFLIGLIADCLGRQRLLLEGVRPLLVELFELKSRCLLALALHLYHHRITETLPWTLADVNALLHAEELHALEDFLVVMEDTFVTLRHSEEDLVRARLQHALLEWMKRKARPSRVTLFHSTLSVAGIPRESVLDALEWWKEKEEFVVDRESSSSPYLMESSASSCRPCVSFAAPRGKRVLRDAELNRIFDSDRWTHLAVKLSRDDLALASELAQLSSSSSSSPSSSATSSPSPLDGTLRLLRWPLHPEVKLDDKEKTVIIDVRDVVSQCLRNPRLAKNLSLC